MTNSNSIDDVLAIVGFGRWQIPSVIINLIVFVAIPIHMVGPSLLSAPAPFRCFSSMSPLEGVANTSFSSTAEPPAGVFDSQCGPPERHPITPSSLRPTGLASCPFVEYDVSVFPETVITEFNLVCERATLRPVFPMVYYFGVMFGGPLGGTIGDRYGRRKAALAGSLLSVVAVVVMAFCPWYEVVLLARFAAGLSLPFMIFTTFNLVQESTPPCLRTTVGMLLGIAFSVGVVLTAGLGYLVRHWRYLLLSAYSITLAVIPLLWVVQESPRWVAQKGRRAEASDMLAGAARRNRVPFTPELKAALERLRKEKFEDDDGGQPAEEGGRGVSLVRLRQSFREGLFYLRSPGMRRVLLVVPVIWYAQSLMYLGIILNANNFTSNNPFVYLALSGVMDGSAILLATPLTLRLGRRLLAGASYFLSAVLLLIDLAITQELQWLKWTLVMVALFLSAAAFQVLFVYTPELYPTVIRSRGFGLANSVSSLGSVTAPLVTDLMAQRAWWAVNGVCGGAGLLACLLLPLLPETRNLPLPETVQDVERRRLYHKGKQDSQAVDEEKNVNQELLTGNLKQDAADCSKHETGSCEQET